jgi:hypothetical protein
MGSGPIYKGRAARMAAPSGFVDHDPARHGCGRA